MGVDNKTECQPLPRKLALLIPALATVEVNCYGIGVVLKEEVIRFLQEEVYYNIESDCQAIKNKLKNDEKFNSQIMDLRIELEDIFTEFEKLKNEIKILYDCGQSFQGWNFENLTDQVGNMIRCEYQKLIFERAKDF